MKLSNILPALVAFGSLLGVLAAPVDNTGVSGTLTARELGTTAEQIFARDTVTSSAQDESVSTSDTDISEREVSHIEERAVLGSRVKLQLLAAGGRILQTIIFDYVITSLLPGGQIETENVAWKINGLSTSPIAAGGNPDGSFFENPAFGNRLILQFATKALGGLFQFQADASGVITGLISSAAITGTSVAPGETIKIFNAANKIIASVAT